MVPRQISLAWLEQNLWSKVPGVIFTQVPILLKVRDYLRELEAGKLKSVCRSSLFLSIEGVAQEADLSILVTHELVN